MAPLLYALFARMADPALLVPGSLRSYAVVSKVPSTLIIHSSTEKYLHHFICKNIVPTRIILIVCILIVLTAKRGFRCPKRKMFHQNILTKVWRRRKKVCPAVSLHFKTFY